jgi:hypothetical protein
MGPSPGSVPQAESRMVMTRIGEKLAWYLNGQGGQDFNDKEPPRTQRTRKKHAKTPWPEQLQTKRLSL